MNGCGESASAHSVENPSAVSCAAIMTHDCVQPMHKWRTSEVANKQACGSQSQYKKAAHSEKWCSPPVFQEMTRRVCLETPVRKEGVPRLQMSPTSFTYLGLHEGIPYFLDARRHGDTLFLFSGSGMSDPDFIMDHGS